MKWTIGRKLAVGFGAILILKAISGVMIYRALDQIGDSADAMTDNIIPTALACDQMLISMERASVQLRGFLLLGDEARHAETFRRGLDDAHKALRDTLPIIETSFKDSASAEELRNLKVLRDTVTPMMESQQNVLATAAATSVETTFEDNRRPAAERLETEVLPKVVEIRNALEFLRESSLTQLASERKTLDAAGETGRATAVLVTSIVLVLGCAIALYMSRHIASRAQVLLAGVRSVAQRDLSKAQVPVESEDELGAISAGFNEMVTALRSILADTRTASGEVAAASGEIAAAAHQQVASLNQSATSLNEITTTSEQFKAAMQEFADRAEAVQEAADETARRVGEGRSLTQDSASRIDRVEANAVAAGESVLQLAEQMQRIGEITGAVNEIAEQTKLLALNASIEAARAGEEGRGFAVVATQVRDLANQSKEAVGRIENLVAETQKSMRNVVQKIEEGGRLSRDSADIVRKVSHAFEEIDQAIEQTREAMAQINLGARQQESGITELVSSITEIDAGSKESLAAAEQTQKSILGIDQRLRELSGTLGQFKT